MAALDQYETHIQAAAKEWDIDPKLLKSLIAHESGGKPDAVSYKGAGGLTQIMPATAKGLGITDPADPVQQIYGGAKYLSEALDKEGTPDKALLYYHGGPDWRSKYGPESAGYVPAVAKQYAALSPKGAPVAADYSDFLKRTGAAPSAEKSAPAAEAAAPSDFSDFLKRTGASAEPPAPAGPPQAPPGAEHTQALYEGRTPDAEGIMPGASTFTMPRTEAEFRAALAEKPGWTSSSLLPIAVKQDANGQADMSLGVRPDWGPLRGIGNMILDAADAPRTGRITPELSGGLLGMAAGGMMPSPARGSGMAIADGAAAPLPAEFKANPGTVTPSLPSGETMPTMTVRPAGDLVPAAAAEVAPARPVAAPKTAAEAKAIASGYYKKADEVGGTLLPDFTNKFITKAENLAPQTAEGKAIAGDTAITGLVDRMQALRDKPLSLQAAQEIDETLGSMADKEFGVKGLSKEGKAILDLQTQFRSMIQDATEGETTGGKAGFDALKQGRAAWAQAMKMNDLERILTRAEQTDNPVTSIRAGIRTLTSNPARVRGYSPEELSALKAAGERGTLGSLLHVFGSRLVPLVVGGAGMSAGVIPGLIGAGVSHGLTTGMRNMATHIQGRRANNAMSVLGSRVPLPQDAISATPKNRLLLSGGSSAP